MDRPKASSSKWAEVWALKLTMQIYYLLRLHRSGVVSPGDSGARWTLDGNAKAKQKNNRNKSVTYVN